MSTVASTAKAPTTDVEMVNVQINDVWHRFPKGTRMIEACRQVGALVPHYCYHPKLTSPGNCRMCLVEMGMPPRPMPGQEVEKDEHGMAKISWMPRPVIACANTVSEGLGIRTESKLSEECRKGVMEFLLINHPLDCPICDQAGECRLQEYSVEHGQGGSQFQEAKVKKPKNVDIGPRVRLDDERCIMCSRCIRFAAEIVDDPVLGFTERGSYTTLAVHEGKRLENNYSLNTVDLCPVGALTSNDFRFQQRVWFLKETSSLCTQCGRGCNMEIGSRERTIYRQTPRENNEVNSSWMCDRGRLDFHFVNSEFRLTQPLAKTGAHHEAISWKQAAELAKEKLPTLASDSLAVVVSARMTNEELFLAKKLIEKLKPAFVDVVPRTREPDNYLRAADMNPNTLGAKNILGIHPGSKIESIIDGIRSGKVKSVIALGENLLKLGLEKADLAKLDYLLSTHILANGTAEHSNLVLPGAAYAEKKGTMINVTGRLQKLNKAVEAPGVAREDWELLQDLVNAVGGTTNYTTAGQVFQALASEMELFKGLTYAQIGDLGVALIETEEKIPLLERERERIKKGIIVG